MNFFVKNIKLVLAVLVLSLALNFVAIGGWLAQRSGVEAQIARRAAIEAQKDKAAAHMDKIDPALERDDNRKF